MHCFLIENYLYEFLRLLNTAPPFGTWQWDPGKSGKKFLDPRLLVVSSKFKPSFLPGFPLKLTKLIHSVFFQFSSSFPPLFFQFSISFPPVFGFDRSKNLSSSTSCRNKSSILLLVFHCIKR